MAQVIRLRCHHCGEPLRDRNSDYCPPCNLALAYRAMPFLLGMLLTGRLTAGTRPCSTEPLEPETAEALNYEDGTALNWE